MGFQRAEPLATDTQVPPSTRPSPALTEAARWTLTVECAGLQGLARSPAEARAGPAGVGPALAHTSTSGHGPLPAAEFQPLVVDVQQADAALEADTDRGPLQHPAARMRSGVRGQRPEAPSLTASPDALHCRWARGGIWATPHPPCGAYKRPVCKVGQTEEVGCGSRVGTKGGSSPSGDHAAAWSSGMPPTDGTESGPGPRVRIEVRVTAIVHTIRPPPLPFTGSLSIQDTAHKHQRSGPRSRVRSGVRATPRLPDPHTEAWSSGTPPTKRSVSRLRPSVPLGLWPRTGVSPSTDSEPRRQCRDSSRRCHRPGSTGTALVSTAGPEPVSNLGGQAGTGTQDSPRAHCSAPPPTAPAALAPPRGPAHLSCTRPPSSASARKSLPLALPL